MRRSDHPNCPSAITCCFLSSLKTLLTLTQGNSRVRINVLDQTFVGRFSGDNHWPHLSDYRGLSVPLSCLFRLSLECRKPDPVWIEFPAPIAADLRSDGRIAVRFQHPLSVQSAG